MVCRAVIIPRIDLMRDHHAVTAADLGPGCAAGLVDVVLIPEVEFQLKPVMDFVEHTVRKKGHCVICVAEGAGQELMESRADGQATGEKDCGWGSLLGRAQGVDAGPRCAGPGVSCAGAGSCPYQGWTVAAGGTGPACSGFCSQVALQASLLYLSRRGLLRQAGLLLLCTDLPLRPALQMPAAIQC